jgi:hypothetical protein
MISVSFHIRLRDHGITSPEAQRIWEQEMFLAMERIDALALSAVQFHTPVRTGKLRQGWYMAQPVRFAHTLVAEVRNRVSYAPYVEAKRHITTKAKRAIGPLLQRQIDLALARVKARLGGRT